MHADDPLLVIATGVPSFPADAWEKPTFSDSTPDEQSATVADPAIEDPTKMPADEHEKVTTPTAIAKMRVNLDTQFNRSLL